MPFPDSIAIVGSIAVGKTSIGQSLAQLNPGFALLPDQAGDNPFLHDFYRDRQRWSFHSRISFLALRSEIYRMPVSGDYAIIDRPVHELIVFASVHHQSGYLSDDEFAVFRSIHETLVALCPTPRLFIRVTCDIDEALRRIAKRKRAFEVGIDRVYLKNIEDEYDAWLHTLPTENVVTIKTDNENPEQLARNLLPLIIGRIG